MILKEKVPFFSVVIPLYNKEPHVIRSITSVLNQTFQDFELIIVNDASTDNSLEKVKVFNDLRIRLLNRDKPGPGGYAARNLGIKESRGQWIAFLDADDEWYSCHLQKMYELIKKFPDVNFLGCGWETKNGDMMGIDVYYKSFYKFNLHKISLEDYIYSSRPVCSSVACINKKYLSDLNLFPEESGSQRGGDVYTWLLLMCKFKEMGWSNHIGAIYHMDSVNMVTKTAPSSIDLYGKKRFENLSKNLTKKEKKLLSRYFNRRLWNVWIKNLLNAEKNFNLMPILFWEGDFLHCLSWSLLSLLPKKLIFLLFSIKKTIWII